MHDRAFEGAVVDARIVLKWTFKNTYCGKTYAAHDWDTLRPLYEDDNIENLLSS
jgi:hypothetical protein